MVSRRRNSEKRGTAESPEAATQATAFQVAQDTISSIAVSTDGRLIISCVGNGRVILSDVDTGLQIREFKADIFPIRAMTFLEDGRQAIISRLADPAVLWNLDTGTKLRQLGGAHDISTSLRLLRGSGSILSGSFDGPIVLFDFESGKELTRLVGHKGGVFTVDVLPGLQRAISGGDDETMRLWNLATGVEMRRFSGHTGRVNWVAALPDGKRAFSASSDNTIRLWDLDTGSELRRFETGGEARVWSMLPGGQRAISGSNGAVHLWDLGTGQELRRIEGNTGSLNDIALMPDGKRVIAADSDGYIRIWPVDDVAPHSHLYTTARVALLGDSGVGKTGLGWRLAHGAFREHPSTHGQQFWVVDRLGATRPDGTQCEAVLWDLAGQPDYRLIHALFLENVDLGLLLFDPANRERPLSGVEYWIKHLGAATMRRSTIGNEQPSDAPSSIAPMLLIAARSDRGAPTLTDGELCAFCQRHGIAGYVRTSALDNLGIDDLLTRIKAAIPWHRLTQTVTTETFKRIKDHVLRLKEEGGAKSDVLLPADVLRAQLRASDPSWAFEDAEMLTAVRHLANHGYVALIQRADGAFSVLLASDLLVNLASSIVLEARRHERGLGLVEESRLLAGNYALPELSGLTLDQQRLLLDEAVRLFLRRNLCFRETVNGTTCLVFPSLINEKRPAALAELTDDVSYRITGEVETVYPAMVVQLGYTNELGKEHHWQTQAEYEPEPGKLCGFRQAGENNGEIEFVLSYSPRADEDTRLLFRLLFERFLKRRRVQVTRLPAVNCSKCKQAQERSAVRRAIDARRSHLYCDACGTKLPTPVLAEVGVPPENKAETVRQAAETTDRRTEYEVAISWVKSFRRDRGDTTPPTCFMSYAWGDEQHERWVEDLADRLQQAEIGMTLDKWHCRPGSDLAKFVERIEAADFICAVGTPQYREKYENRDQDAVVRAELRVINARHMKRDEHHDTVIPLLRQSSREDSYPPLLRSSVAIDLRNDRDFLSRMFELVLTIHRIGFDHPMARQHRKAIVGEDKR